MIDQSNILQYKPNLRKRILSTLLDYGLFLFITFIYVMYFGYNNEEGGKTVDGFLALPVPVFWFIYFVLIESFYGATPGHHAFNLMVLRIDRRKITFCQALRRHLLDPIDILFYGIPALISIKNSDKNQRIGDMWAKTIVVDITDSEQYNEI